jgi:hypothetical protein
MIDEQIQDKLTLLTKQSCKWIYKSGISQMLWYLVYSNFENICWKLIVQKVCKANFFLNLFIQSWTYDLMNKFKINWLCWQN